MMVETEALWQQAVVAFPPDVDVSSVYTELPKSFPLAQASFTVKTFVPNPACLPLRQFNLLLPPSSPFRSRGPKKARNMPTTPLSLTGTCSSPTEPANTSIIVSLSLFTSHLVALNMPLSLSEGNFLRCFKHACPGTVVLCVVLTGPATQTEGLSRSAGAARFICGRRRMWTSRSRSASSAFGAVHASRSSRVLTKEKSDALSHSDLPPSPRWPAVIVVNAQDAPAQVFCSARPRTHLDLNKRSLLPSPVRGCLRSAVSARRHTPADSVRGIESGGL